MKTALSAAAQNLTSFFMAQIKAEPLSEEGLPGEEESFEEVGDRRELCHDERCVTGGLERHPTGVTSEFLSLFEGERGSQGPARISRDIMGTFLLCLADSDCQAFLQIAWIQS